MSDPSDDGIARLLRATGRRPAPPAERAARVREAAWMHWRADRRQRLRRRVFWLGVAAAAACLLVAVVVLQRPAATLAARIERAEPPASGTAGEVLLAGTRLSTGAGGRVACRLESGHALRLDRATRVRLLSDRRVRLESGALYVDSALAQGHLEIGTPFGSVKDVGTQFLVRLGGEAMQVRVREGAVVLTGSSVTLEVREGQVLEIGAEGPVLRADEDEEAWAWVGEIAPTPAIEGRSAREFLDWAAREKGLSLRFESAELAEAASRTLLRGSIDGMTADQALTSVLPTCGMGHRVEGRVLHVSGVH
jgi:ferric-dicitrate binding protein FerR (iron transport regulator)